ncbi:MAG: DUF2062 domain-containing protein [Desulfovibrionaceae bacterium]
MRPKPKYSWWRRQARCSRYWYLRVVRQHASAHNIARGLALGVFIGALPIIPFQSVVVIALAFLLRTNKFAAWLATCYSNVFTLVPFYYFLYRVGELVVPVQGLVFDPQHLTMRDLITAGWDLFGVMMLGGVVFGVPATVLTYFVSLKAVQRYRQMKSERRARRRAAFGK